MLPVRPEQRERRDAHDERRDDPGKLDPDERGAVCTGSPAHATAAR